LASALAKAKKMADEREKIYDMNLMMLPSDLN
jgi:hypothetical protein